MLEFGLRKRGLRKTTHHSIWTRSIKTTKGQTNIYISNYNENRGCRFYLPPYLRLKFQYHTPLENKSAKTTRSIDCMAAAKRRFDSQRLGIIQHYYMQHDIIICGCNSTVCSHFRWRSQQDIENIPISKAMDRSHTWHTFTPIRSQLVFKDIGFCMVVRVMTIRMGQRSSGDMDDRS